jgi:glycosyltransferase involved in cell wall biosynthesis
VTPLRVAVVARAVMPLHGFGGLERHVHDLVRHLAARGVQVTLITPPPRPDRRELSSESFGSLPITLRHVPYLTFPLAGRRGTTVIDRSTAYPLFGWRAGRVALALARRGEIDIVHGLGASVLGYAIARRRAGPGTNAPASNTATAPLVFNPQGLEEFGASGPSQAPLKRLGYLPLRAAVRICAQAADRIIATDRALEPVVIRHLHPAPGQLCTVPNAIDLASASGLAGPAEGEAIRRRHGILPTDLVVLSVGRLEENKGFDQLADALARAAASGGSLARQTWHWVLVGEGPYRQAIARAIAQHGLGTRARLVGRASESDLHAWYEAASFFAHPTRYEGSSLVTLEAMAHRTAVVATTAGGLPDKVRPGVNGWLVPPGDVEALARALEEAAGDPARLVAMGERGREIVARDFAWTVVVERQLDVYRDLLRSGRDHAHRSFVV